jgi:hypothetical protein
MGGDQNAFRMRSIADQHGLPGNRGQLVQAMAGFGGDDGADDSSNAVVLGADTSQQFLATPQA